MHWKINCVNKETTSFEISGGLSNVGIWGIK